MDAKRLEDLQHQLGALEHKVQAYRHGLIVDFQRRYQETLRDMSPSAARDMERSLDSILSNYPVLGPELKAKLDPDQVADASSTTSHPSLEQAQQQPQHQQQQIQQQHAESQIQSPSQAAATTNSIRTSPPFAVFGAAAAGADSPDVPHEREQEFQGLFTPSYLPLLEGSPRAYPLQSPVAASSSAAQGDVNVGSGAGSTIGVETTADLQGLQDMEGPSETGAASQHQDLQGASQAALQRPGPGRHSTDDTISSEASDKGDTKIRRSALRRSSSSSKAPHSPRRVRFEFRGAEVLPTASPQATDYPTPRPSSPATSDKSRSFAEIVGDDSGDEGALPQEGLPPRKISSSEALRALSRTPLEAGTVWTVVNPNSDESASERDSSRASPISPKMSSENIMASSPTMPPTTTQPSAEPKEPARLLVNLEAQEAIADNDSSSDDEFLAMAKPKSFANKKSIQSPHSPVDLGPNPVPSTMHSANGKEEPHTMSKDPDEEKDQTSSEDFDAEEEDMFHFESGGLRAPPRPRQSRPPKVQAESPPSSPLQDVDEDDMKVPYGTSPAVPISRLNITSGPSTPTTSKFQIGSLGSYKGRPVVMPVVKNPEVHEQAASLGQFNTFVGGLDGRSGMDEGDLNSFRASLVHHDFTGTPRSLTERLMMEEARMAKASREYGSG
jgi:hypothetical protein